MLGIDGIGVFLAFLGCLLATLLCVIYGIKYWNVPLSEEENLEIDEEIEWEKHDPELGGE